MYEILLTVHLIGIIFGAGSAFVSDTLFFGIMRDNQIEKSELSLLKIVSKLVWFGLIVAVISGFFMLAINQFIFLQEPFFQVKLILIFIIIINGLVMHKKHLPFLKTLVNKKNVEKEVETKNDTWQHFKSMFISGPISMVSWLMVIILGSMRSLTLDFSSLLVIYIVILIVSIIISQFMLHHMFPKHRKIKIKKHSFKRGLLPHIIVTVMAIVLFLLVLLPLAKNNSSIKSNRIDTSFKLTPKEKLKWDTGNHVTYAPNVPEVSKYKDQRIFEVKLEVLENVCPIDEANGINFDTWGYRIEGDNEVLCGAPGPTLRGRVGDVARITLTNLPGNKHPHNIDFHAFTGPGGGAMDLTVAPGETASIDVRLLYAGAFMYHCAYGDIPVHIASGMYGTFIVDPEKPLPKVDHEWSITQSEWYTTKPDENGLAKLDRTALLNEEPSIITFNGTTGGLIGDKALNMKVGERARIYFVNQGISLTSNFHPIGSHWDIVYPEGATHIANRVIHGSQSTSVVAGGSSVVELVAKVPGSIILVDHALTRAFYKGAKGIINVTGDDDSEIYEIFKLPISANGKKDDMDSHMSGNVSDDEVNKINIKIPVGAALPSKADSAYIPNKVTVKVGTTVTWTNEDNVMHTVTSGISNGEYGTPDGKFDSGFLKKGQSFSYTFNTVGEFNYYCAPHPWAKGTVTVEE